MRLTVPRRRSDDERTLPLINIVFLLLIFFMIAGRIDGGDPFDVEPPSTDRADAAESVEMVIHLAADGRVALDGQEVPMPLLVEAVAAEWSDASAARLVIKADGRLAATEVVATMEALHAVGVARVTLIAAAER